MVYRLSEKARRRRLKLGGSSQKGACPAFAMM